MPDIMIVNPRRKRAKAAKKKTRKANANSGGASMSAKKKKKSTSKKRPTVTNKGRKRRSMTVTVRNLKPKKRRNPRGMSVALPGAGSVDIIPVIGGTGIAIASRLIPSYLTSIVALPTAGIPGYLVQAASGIGLSYVVKEFLKQPKVAEYGVLFTLSNVLTRLADDLIFKGETLGSLLGQGYPPSIWAGDPMLETERMLGDVGLLPGQSPSIYADMGVSGQFTPGVVVDRFRARF
jgi:hypothetical protein